jgi:hypothetical protein
MFSSASFLSSDVSRRPGGAGGASAALKSRRGRGAALRRRRLARCVAAAVSSRLGVPALWNAPVSTTGSAPRLVPQPMRSSSQRAPFAFVVVSSHFVRQSCPGPGCGPVRLRAATATETNSAPVPQGGSPSRVPLKDRE